MISMISRILVALFFVFVAPSARSQEGQAIGGFCPLTGCTYSGPILVPAGSATTPGLGVGIAGTGLYSVSTTGLGLTVNGADFLDYGISNSGQVTVLQTLRTFNITTSNTSTISFGTRGEITSPANSQIQIGPSDSSTILSQSIFFQNVVAGTSNTAGANATIQASLSSGNAAPGDFILKTGTVGVSGTQQNPSVNAIVVKGGTQHFSYGGSIPVVSACGSGTPAIDTKATDSSGTVTTGTVATTCTVTFAKAYTTFNHCRVSSESSISGLAYSYTLSALVVTASVLGGDAFDYDCDGI